MSVLLQAVPVVAHASIGFLLGSILGSFLNALSYRLPRGQSIIHPRSSCPHCHTALGISDLVPILSYVWHRGRCAHCHVPYGRRYLYLELVTAGCSALVFAVLWGNWFIVPVMAMLGTGICRIIMRLETRASA